MSASAEAIPIGLIGPNAVTRLAQALAARKGEEILRAVFEKAGLETYLAAPPVRMVDELDVAALHAAMINLVGPLAAADVSAEAGRLTGDYLLANRIPRLAQILLRLMPNPLAARILVRAVARHAWTFAGSGHFSYSFAPGLTLRLEGSPISRYLHTDEPACSYFAATFERIFSAMLGPQVRVTEIACTAAGAEACVFRVSWEQKDSIFVDGSPEQM